MLPRFARVVGTYQPRLTRHLVASLPMIRFPSGLFAFLLGTASGIGPRAQNIDAGPFLGLGTTYFVKSGTRDSLGALVPFRQCYTKKCGLIAGDGSGPPAGRPQ